jgi:hypothetical protein
MSAKKLVVIIGHRADVAHGDDAFLVDVVHKDAKAVHNEYV